MITEKNKNKVFKSRLSRAVWTENCVGFVIFTMPAPYKEGGTHNGYILLEPEHRLYDMDYDSANAYIDVHGGLTYGAMEQDGRKCFGFDVGHLDDTPEKCDHEYVKSQCRYMATQCDRIKEEGLLND